MFGKSMLRLRKNNSYNVYSEIFHERMMLNRFALEIFQKDVIARNSYSKEIENYVLVPFRTL